ncbi:MAG TPA: preprotein translocase subunit SecG [Deltaproteobacteria bacterium]|nr:preprotein translocase subunit SecG [Deltaproteobacteria bacterium]HCP45134.1 preprotein translocase subunit SecG [Deltaproteobacteria bacterium]|tara:strand:- start:202 stop:672 length:471 start_codon:yes stop_codon:yes gene_type:complete
MEVVITAMHITLCFFLLLVVLLQPGKGADFGAAMGGSSSEVFGATGGVTLLGKLTAIAAAMFMGTSLALAWLSNAPPAGDLMPEALEASSRAEAAQEAEAAPTTEQSTSPAADEAAAPTGDGAGIPAAEEAGAPTGDEPTVPAGDAAPAPAGEDNP